MRILIFCLFFLFLIILSVGCRQDQSNIPNLTSQQIYFANMDYMTLSVTNTDKAPSYILHESGQGNSQTICRIAKTDLDVGGQEILCWLEAEELDLFFNGVDFSLEIPSGVCDYVKYSPYMFYQYAWGRTDYGAQGQPWIVYSADGCVSCTRDPALTLQAPFTANGICYATTYTANDYNYDDVYTNGPLCDEGTVLTKTLSFDDPGSAACTNNLTNLSQAESTSVPMGGMRGNCVSGPAIELEKKNTYTNLPIPEIYSALEGLQKTFSLKSPSSLGQSTNLYLANYVKDCADNDYDYPVENILNYSVGSTVDVDTTTDKTVLRDPLKESRPFYAFTCYNKAHEVKGIIRVQIRDWDTHFTVTDSIDKTAPPKMDVLGDEPLEYPEAYNDIADWDDYIKTGATSSCSTDPTADIFNFPKTGL